LGDEWLEKHLERLESNARKIGLQWPYSNQRLMDSIRRLYQPESPVCRVTVFPNVAGYGDFYREESLPVRLLLSWREPGPNLSRIALQTIRYQRPMASIKLNAMAELILLKRQARLQGIDDILLVNQQGCISEASTANIFFIHRGELVTPQPEHDHCLPGITRLRVLDVARRHDVMAYEQSLCLDDISAMDGAFLTNAAQGLISVRCIDQYSFPWSDGACALLKGLEAALVSC
jgi:branched-subunit amino acid aminotransferase/4-amino-4-deoxychorismate lyase